MAAERSPRGNVRFQGSVSGKVVEMPHRDQRLGMSRRSILLAPVAAAALKTKSATAQNSQPTMRQDNPPTTRVSFHVNGTAADLDIDNRTTMLDALREHLHLTGSKKGCDH